MSIGDLSRYDSQWPLASSSCHDPFRAPHNRAVLLDFSGTGTHGHGHYHHYSRILLPYEPPVCAASCAHCPFQNTRVTKRQSRRQKRTRSTEHGQNAVDDLPRATRASAYANGERTSANRESVSRVATNRRPLEALLLWYSLARTSSSRGVAWCAPVHVRV